MYNALYGSVVPICRSYPSKVHHSTYSRPRFQIGSSNNAEIMVYMVAGRNAYNIEEMTCSYLRGILHHRHERILGISLKGDLLVTRYARVENGSFTIGLMSGCGTASNLWKSSFNSGPILMYAPLFSVLSQYFGAENTIGLVNDNSTPNRYR